MKKFTVNPSNMKTLSRFVSAVKFAETTKEVNDLMAQKSSLESTVDKKELSKHKEYIDVNHRLVQIKSGIILAIRYHNLGKYAESVPHTIEQYPVADVLVDGFISKAHKLADGAEHARTHKKDKAKAKVELELF